MIKSCIGLALVATALTGCTENDYDLHLKPTGKSIERRLAVKQRSSNPEKPIADELKRIAAAYGVDPPPVGSTKHAFQGVFSGRLPADLSGYGNFIYWESLLGSVSLYHERFQGNDDAAGELKRRQATADRLVELLVNGLEPQLKADPGWPALRRFLSGDFRHDLHNIGIYAWTWMLNESEATAPFARIGQYAVERGYFTPEEIPDIKRAFADLSRENAVRAKQWVSMMFAKKVGADVPQAFKNLESLSQLGESFSNYLETTDEYVLLLKKKKLSKNDPRPEGSEVVTELFVQLIFGDVFKSGDQVTVTLNSSQAPLFTNGKWSAQKQRIEWPPKSLSQSGFPSLAYAAWCDPDEEFQLAHFGAVILVGQELLTVCEWFHGLTDSEKMEWDAFIANLRPGPDLISTLKSFRFRDEPVTIQKKLSIAGEITALIIDELAKRPTR